VRRTGQLLLFVLIGLGLAWATSVDVEAVAHSGYYKLGAHLLLAIGLYGATYGIDLRQARHDKRVISTAVTVGVVLKALLIGGILALAWQDPLFLILGVAVAQIDPLSVAALMGDERMSPRARTVLAAWSSFDDPFTVVLSIYAAAVAVNTFGIGDVPPTGSDPLLLYATDLGGNLALAGAAWLVWRLIGDRPWLRYLALAGFFATSVTTGWMLAIAIIGLFARPAALDALIPGLTRWALYAASVALGVLLIDGIQIWQGISLGIAAFAAQIFAAGLLTGGMLRADRWHLAFAQQNGITAIILALTLQIQFDGVVAVVAPAIITANLIHAVANRFVDRKLLAERNAALSHGGGATFKIAKGRPSYSAPKFHDLGDDSGDGPAPRHHQ
jgi:NhaP-type Na+/H+ or K+/H+ antiporter